MEGFIRLSSELDKLQIDILGFLIGIKKDNLFAVVDNYSILLAELFEEVNIISISEYFDIDVDIDKTPTYVLSSSEFKSTTPIKFKIRDNSVELNRIRQQYIHFHPLKSKYPLVLLKKKSVLIV